MCGIFGFVKTKESAGISNKNLLRGLVKLSESRGKESSGIAYRTNDNIGVFKMPERGSRLIKSPTYKKIIADNLKAPFAIIGHARLVTNGLLEDNLNNQPVIKDGIIGIHNGIIVNDHRIWTRFNNLSKNSGVDTEALLALIKHFEKNGKSLPGAVTASFKEIEGTASVALLFNNFPYLMLATNNGSLYFTEKDDLLIFASEELFLKSLLNKTDPAESKIQRIEPNEAYLIKINNLEKIKFSLNDTGNNKFYSIEPQIMLNINDSSNYKKGGSNLPPSLIVDIKMPEKFPVLDNSRINLLKRCSKCILPETMPFINFDTNGVCNYCHNHQKIKLRSESDIKQLILNSKNNDSKFDCIVPLSGGRDSSFALHYTKEVLGLNPIAYSYDWGMLTDLGRRNQARMCGKLGVEHILISADIRKKRNNIRKNVIAWLKKPDLGIIPLFMAGDKQYFHYANQLRKNIGGAAVLYAENPLEKTNFKSGFCGIPPVFRGEHLFNIGLANKLKLGGYYLKEYIKNPSLINSSLIDTIDAYISSYFIPHDYMSLYLYKKWNEQEIVSTLVEKYNWELATDTKTSWRIGDGTAAFYNLIYYAVAGFTEIDTFRSNQIREGEITRDLALKLAHEENNPRYESIKWYCDIIGIDFKDALNKILSIPKLF